MEKRILMVILLSFIFICGYTSNYSVTIDENIQENISVNIFPEDLENTNNSARSFLEFEQYAIIGEEDSAIYARQITKEANRTKVDLQYTYPFDKFKNAKYANTCFDNKTYINNNDYIYFRGYGGFYCLSQKELRITVTTDKLVMKSNADIIEGNNYIWKVTTDNKNDFEMEIQISNNKDEKPKSEIKIMGVFKIIIGIIIGIAIIIIVVTIKREQKRTYM